MGLSQGMEHMCGEEVEIGANTAFWHVDAHNFLAARVHSRHSFCLKTKVKDITTI